MDFSPLVKSINTSFETTSRFWDEIGLTEDERSEQTRKLFESIHATLNSFVSQAEKTRDDMVKTIQQSVDESKSLCQLLSMNHHIPPLQVGLVIPILPCRCTPHPLGSVPSS